MKDMLISLVDLLASDQEVAEKARSSKFFVCSLPSSWWLHPDAIVLCSLKIPKHTHKLQFIMFCWLQKAFAEILHSKAYVWSAQARPKQGANSLLVKLCPLGIQDDVGPSWCLLFKLICW